jgi:hypothetical protein
MCQHQTAYPRQLQQTCPTYVRSLLCRPSVLMQTYCMAGPWFHRPVVVQVCRTKCITCKMFAQQLRNGKEVTRTRTCTAAVAADDAGTTQDKCCWELRAQRKLTTLSHLVTLQDCCSRAYQVLQPRAVRHEVEVGAAEWASPSPTAGGCCSIRTNTTTSAGECSALMDASIGVGNKTDRQHATAP